MLEEVCREIKNWFDVQHVWGTFQISNGKLNLACAQDGQYIRICGSVFNDGIYAYPADGLKDETFEGAVWLLAIPKEILTLSDDIDAYKEKYKTVLTTPYQSESFGGYSYTKASGNSGSGSDASWQSVFAKRLNRWRKL